jgi:hypothetical protein
LDDRGELSTEYVGFTIRCETHDLGGVIRRKAEMDTGLFPHEPQGVWIRERLDGFDPRAVAPRERRAGSLADAIYD